MPVLSEYKLTWKQWFQAWQDVIFMLLIVGIIAIAAVFYVGVYVPRMVEEGQMSWCDTSPALRPSDVRCGQIN